MIKNELDLFDELRAIAQLGLNYAKDPFDLERYHRLMDIVAQFYAPVSGLEPGLIKSRFARELGYITPKIGVQGVLFEPGGRAHPDGGASTDGGADVDKAECAGRILLEKRKDDGCWGLPSGWVETGERPDRALVREFREEAGLDVVPERIIGFYTRLPGEYAQPHTSVHILYVCKYVGGSVVKSHESLEMEYRDPRGIPQQEWHKDHWWQAEAALAARSGRSARWLEVDPNNHI